MTNDLQEAALRYAEQEWAVLPLWEPRVGGGCTCPKGAKCKRVGKHPRTIHGLLDASLDPEQIRRWWKRWPNANIGLLTEGWFIVDVDPRNDGVATLIRLEAEHGALEAPCNLTGEYDGVRGKHYRYRQNGRPIPKGKLGPGIEVQANGGYIVAAPSMHASGVRYEWELGDEPFAPAWMVDQLLNGTVGNGNEGGTGSRSMDELEANPPVAGDRQPWSASWCGHKARKHRGDRAAYDAACLDGWGRIVDRNGFDEREFRGVMDSIWKTDQRRLGDGSALALAPDGFRLTDVGNSERFIKLMGGKVRYAHIWSCWLVYRKGRWIRDPKGELVTEMGKRVAKSLLALVAKMPVSDRDDQKSERDRVYKAAIRLESKASIFAMVQLARGIPGVIVDHEELDANPDILNCLNGTVDLRTGDLRPHDPADLCTQQCPVNYDPNAQAPLWEACLLRWQPDPEIREYLQREAGAGACGRQTETLSIHYGHGANGKSKYWGAIGKALGPYAMVPHKSLIVASRHEQHPTVVASLFRARLAIASETEKSANINEEQVKNLTGNDRISARKMYQDEWSFDPSHTLVLFSNFLPTIQGTDNGIWRRVRMIPWDVTIPVDERDEELADKLTTEAAGILRWMVEGAVRFLEVGIGAPASIQASTAEFRGEQDTVTRFITEAGLVFDPNGSVRSADLQVVHEEWCDEAGEDARGHYKRVAHELTRRGARAERRKTGRYWAGVALVDQQSRRGVSGEHYPMELPERGGR